MQKREIKEMIHPAFICLLFCVVFLESQNLHQDSSA